MSFTKTFFVAIDKIFERSQNPRKMQKELSDISLIGDVSYSERYPEVKMDIYNVADVGKNPVIFEIHGGGFAAGDKKYRRCLCKFFAKHTGATVFNVNYGVGHENACPVPMLQLVDAVNFVAGNADKYNLDLSRFVVTGDSAGAYYACFLALLQDSEELQKMFQCTLNTRITAVILNCGVYDFTKYTDKKTWLNNGICREFSGKNIKEVTESKYFEAMRLPQFVTKDFPPALVIYAQKDVFCKGQGEKLVAVLKKNGVETESTWSEKLSDNHTYSLTWKSKKAKQTNDKILDFLRRHFQSNK